MYPSVNNIRLPNYYENFSPSDVGKTEDFVVLDKSFDSFENFASYEDKDICDDGLFDQIQEEDERIDELLRNSCESESFIMKYRIPDSSDESWKLAREPDNLLDELLNSHELDADHSKDLKFPADSDKPKNAKHPVDNKIFTKLKNPFESD